jgi:hypothetical protein
MYFTETGRYIAVCILIVSESCRSIHWGLGRFGLA